MRRVANLNDLAKSDPNLANNPYLRGLMGSNASNNNNRQPRNPSRNNGNPRKKTKTKHACQNEENAWIVELFQEKARKVTGQKQNAYNTAIRNIKKTPFAIRHENTATAVQGIGGSFAKIIKQKLIQNGKYLSQDPNQARQNARYSIEENNKHQQKAASKPPKKKRKKTQKGPFKPRLKSGGYAILVHLYDLWQRDNVQGASKEQLIRDAQQYCTSSFTDAQGTYYTAWASSKKLLTVGYIQRINRGNKGHEFYLTEAGKDIGGRLHRQLFKPGEPMPPLPDRSIFSQEAWPRNDEDDDEDDHVDAPKPKKERKKKEKRFMCPYCDKGYVQETSYKKHVETKHKDGANSKQNRNALPPPNRPKRKSDDMMVLDDDIQPQRMAKRQRISANMNTIDMNANLTRIKINGEWYELYLVYDTCEERRKNRNERIKLENEFKRHRINAEAFSLPIGDFCWTLKHMSDANKVYLYPVIVERKRMDDLSKSIKDKRYQEQKWRIKHNIPHFHHIYLIEEHHADSEITKRQIVQSLVNTEIRDGFLIYHTKSLSECCTALTQWTRVIHDRIIKTVEMNAHKQDYDFFGSEQCVAFESFNTAMNVKKNLNIPARILFGRHLMAIPGVTDMIASQIILKYPTLRQLYRAWDATENEEEAKRLLYKVMNGTCMEWHRDLDSGLIKIDQDLRNVCRAMDNTAFKPVTENLSKKIWNAFYNAMQ